MPQAELEEPRVQVVKSSSSASAPAPASSFTPVVESTGRYVWMVLGVASYCLFIESLHLGLGRFLWTPDPSRLAMAPRIFDRLQNHVAAGLANVPVFLVAAAIFRRSLRSASSLNLGALLAMFIALARMITGGIVVAAAPGVLFRTKSAIHWPGTPILGESRLDMWGLLAALLIFTLVVKFPAARGTRES